MPCGRACRNDEILRHLDLERGREYDVVIIVFMGSQDLIITGKLVEKSPMDRCCAYINLNSYRFLMSYSHAVSDNSLVRG